MCRAKLGTWSAPPELTEISCARFYKHFVPAGLRGSGPDSRLDKRPARGVARKMRVPPQNCFTTDFGIGYTV